MSAIALGSRQLDTDRAKLAAENQQIIATIRAAMDAGITFLNTADFYGMGRFEMLIGEVLKRNREKAFISAKCGMRRSPTGNYLGMDCRPESIKNFCSYSLQRLGVDEIDLFQPARLDPQVPLEETIGAIADLIKEGKVKYLGMSEIGADDLRRAHAVHPVAALEIEYSLATRFIEKEILPTARELGIGIVPYSVLCYGLLTGTLTAPLPQNDPMSAMPRFKGENLTHNLKIVDALKAMADEKGVSASQLAIAWVLAQGDDIIPIVGMSKPSRVPDNLKALEIELTSEDLARLDKTFAIGVIQGGRYPEALSSLVPS